MSRILLICFVCIHLAIAFDYLTVNGTNNGTKSSDLLKNNSPEAKLNRKHIQNLIERGNFEEVRRFKRDANIGQRKQWNLLDDLVDAIRRIVDIVGLGDNVSGPNVDYVNGTPS
ncbi:uncharacterized protein LOC143912527 [Arctopsyche grandis]|uniref:uncharacterized protein LOC143912527 n=1 Tax=Arctopsyche grandis TaxID=121162 RepID=UPI00406D7387